MNIFIKVIKLNYMYSENVSVHLEALARHSQLRRVALEHWVTKWVRSPLRPGRRLPGGRTPAGCRVCRLDTCAAREATGRCSSCGTRVYTRKRDFAINDFELDRESWISGESRDSGCDACESNTRKVLIKSFGNLLCFT